MQTHIKNFDNFNDSDKISKLAKWSIFKGGYSLYQHLSTEDAITEISIDIKSLLNEEFPEGFKNIPSIFTAYRIVKLEDNKKLDRKNLGLHWFADIKRLNGNAFIKQFFNNRKNIYLLEANISLDDVDINRSLIQRIMSPIENEVLLKTDINLKLVSIKPLG